MSVAVVARLCPELLQVSGARRPRFQPGPVALEAAERRHSRSQNPLLEVPKSSSCGFIHRTYRKGLEFTEARVQGLGALGQAQHPSLAPRLRSLEGPHDKESSEHICLTRLPPEVQGLAGPKHPIFSDCRAGGSVPEPELRGQVRCWLCQKELNVAKPPNAATSMPFQLQIP